LALSFGNKMYTTLVIKPSQNGIPGDMPGKIVWRQLGRWYKFRFVAVIHHTCVIVCAFVELGETEVQGNFT
jgi:hypothetical protein